MIKMERKKTKKDEYKQVRESKAWVKNREIKVNIERNR